MAKSMAKIMAVPVADPRYSLGRNACGRGPVTADRRAEQWPHS